MTHGGIVYDKLDGRKMIIMESINIGSQTMYRCRYFNKNDECVYATYYEFELKKTKPKILGFLPRNR